LSFYWDAFGIEGMDEEKMVSFDFGGAADTWCWGCHALGARARQVRLTADPGEQICSPHAWGRCLLCQKLQVAWF
jgi:hypothetical protein